MKRYVVSEVWVTFDGNVHESHKEWVFDADSYLECEDWLDDHDLDWCSYVIEDRSVDVLNDEEERAWEEDEVNW